MDSMIDILKIGDIQLVPDKGIVLVCGLIKKNIDCNKLIGQNIYIETKDKGIMVVNVLNITMSNSLIDKKNIFCLIAEKFKNQLTEGEIILVEEKLFNQLCF